MSDEVSGPIFVHFSALLIDGYKSAKPGDAFDINVEGPLSFDQDGCRYVARSARLLGS